MTLRHIGLFEGIGGFSLAARWMGWETIAWCEWNEFGQRVLRHHFPKAEGHGDITTTDFRPYRGKCDILTGGFPCQPYSSAGKRLGKEDDRHLWPEMLRAVREVRPKWVVGENVLGIVNWNDGLVFDEVQADLESEGYEVQPYVLPACAVNAPHRRDRTWFVAFNPNSPTSGKGTYLGGKDGGGISEPTKERVFQEKNDKCTGFREVPPKEGISSNASRERYESPTEKWKGMDTSKEEAVYGGSCYAGTRAWENFPTQSPICCRDDGLPNRLDRKAILDLLKGGIPREPFIPFSKWRNESIKAYGNAIVPQVALQIFKSIEKYEELCKKQV